MSSNGSDYTPRDSQQYSPMPVSPSWKPKLSPSGVSHGNRENKLTKTELEERLIQLLKKLRL